MSFTDANPSHVSWSTCNTIAHKLPLKPKLVWGYSDTIVDSWANPRPGYV